MPVEERAAVIEKLHVIPERYKGMTGPIITNPAAIRAVARAYAVLDYCKVEKRAATLHWFNGIERRVLGFWNATLNEYRLVYDYVITATAGGKYLVGATAEKQADGTEKLVAGVSKTALIPARWADGKDHRIWSGIVRQYSADEGGLIAPRISRAVLPEARNVFERAQRDYDIDDSMDAYVHPLDHVHKDVYIMHILYGEYPNLLLSNRNQLVLSEFYRAELKVIFNAR